MTKTKKIWFKLGLFVPIFYFGLFTVLGFLLKGYNPISTGMSELGAVDSPFRFFANILGFSFMGVTIMLFACAFFDRFRKNLHLKGVALLAFISGFFLFLVGFLPCDAGCVDVTLTGRLHSFTSTVPAILLPLAAIFSSYSLSKIWGNTVGSLSFFLGVASLLSGPAMFLSGSESYVGLIQRSGMGFSLIWIILVSFQVLQERK